MNSGSEADALAVPVDESGKWLPERIDLDSHGEIMRIGVQKALLEGHFSGLSSSLNTSVIKKNKISVNSLNPIDQIPNISHHRHSSQSSPNNSTHKYNFPNSSYSDRYGYDNILSVSSSLHESLSMIQEEVNIIPAAPPLRRQISLSSSSSPPNIGLPDVISAATTATTESPAVIPLVSTSSSNSRKPIRNTVSLSPSPPSSPSILGPGSSPFLSTPPNHRGPGPGPGPVSNTSTHSRVSLLSRQSSSSSSSGFDRLLLQCGMEIRSYSLTSHSEYTKAELLSRCVTIVSAPIPYNPKADLVLNDLKVTPAVIAAIDRAWSSPTSLGR